MIFFLYALISNQLCNNTAEQKKMIHHCLKRYHGINQHKLSLSKNDGHSDESHSSHNNNHRDSSDDTNGYNQDFWAENGHFDPLKSQKNRITLDQYVDIVQIALFHVMVPNGEIEEAISFVDKDVNIPVDKSQEFRRRLLQVKEQEQSKLQANTYLNHSKTSITPHNTTTTKSTSIVHIPIDSDVLTNNFVDVTENNTARVSNPYWVSVCNRSWELLSKVLSIEQQESLFVNWKRLHLFMQSLLKFIQGSKRWVAICTILSIALWYMYGHSKLKFLRVIKRWCQLSMTYFYELWDMGFNFTGTGDALLGNVNGARTTIRPALRLTRGSQ